MEKDSVNDVSAEYEELLNESPNEHYVLSLYVAGQTPRSIQAIMNIKQICEKELQGRYDLEIVDIYQEPDKAKDEQLFALPTLIKKLPAPLRRVIGDLSNTQKVIVGLNITPKK